MPEKGTAKRAGRGLALRLALGAAAAACAVVGCIFLPYGNAKQTAPETKPLSTIVEKEEAPAVSLKLVCSSVELDLSVEIRNESDVVVTGFSFAVTITPAEGEVIHAADEDKDGVIAVENLEAGACTVTLDAMEGFIAPAPTEAAVAPRIEREVIDVSDKVVDASEVDAATEDAQYGNSSGADDSANAVEETVPVAPVTPEPSETPAAPEPTFPGYEWQSADGKIYYIGQDGNKLTGVQNINGTAYRFDKDGVLEGTLGIDVSTYQEDIDWDRVKASGITFVMIRLGYRGYGTGRLVLDDLYESHIQGALAAGLKVGVYFFTQAISVEEAVEEASMCVQYVRGYHISYPIAIDTEYIGVNDYVRANNLSVDNRTKICAAFCDTIRSAGYTPAIYASANWLHNQLNLSQLTAYMTWLAHYTEKTDYSGSYGIWQYTSLGSIDGINGRVDLNVSYLETPPTATPIPPAEPPVTEPEPTPETQPEPESAAEPEVAAAPPAAVPETEVLSPEAEGTPADSGGN